MHSSHLLALARLRGVAFLAAGEPSAASAAASVALAVLRGRLLLHIYDSSSSLSTCIRHNMRVSCVVKIHYSSQHGMRAAACQHNQTDPTDA